VSSTFKPATADQVREAVAWAAGEEQPLEVLSQGSKRGLGRPIQVSHSLDLSGLTGVTLYEPEELVLSARAGTSIAEIEALLEGKRQQLAFEPPDYGPLFGGELGAGSLGGVLACNLSGPRRIKAGAARDHFLGVSGVSGRGESFKSGGRVVKNVTGYDLMKAMAGSYGTLAAMTDVTVKVLPRPERTYTALAYGLEDTVALRAMIQALNSSHEVAGAAHLPAAAAARSAVARVADAGGGVTAIRVEGPGPSVVYRCGALRELLNRFGETEELHSQNSLAFWQEIRDVHPFSQDLERTVWKVSMAPSNGAAIAAKIPDSEVFYDWGGGLIWLSLPDSEDGGAAAVRSAIAETGGHASLIRGTEQIRASAAVFQPQDAAMAALTQRVKESFDPRHILNPGRMYAGV